MKIKCLIAIIFSTFFQDRNEDKENEETPAPKSVRTVEKEIVVTGGMDDLVRIWEYTEEGEMRLKHKLAEHSLGVVSVYLSKDAKRKDKALSVELRDRPPNAAYVQKL